MYIIKRHWSHFFGQLIKDKRAPKFVNILLLLLLVIISFQMLKLFWSTPIPQAEPLNLSVTKTEKMADWHIFGLYQQNYDNLPETNLTLQLKGVEVVVGHDLSHLSEAIISNPNNQDKVYHIGDTLPGGAVIKDILKDRVILDNNGRLEKLSLPKNNLIKVIVCE